MTVAGVEQLRIECEELARRVSAADDAGHDWTAPSNLPGWTQGDVLTHVEDLLDRVLDPERRPSRDDDVDARGDAGVAARQRGGRVAVERSGGHWRLAERATEALAAMQVPVAGDLLLHFGTAGQHPTHLWADGLVYELVVHRCFDLGLGDVLPDSIPPAIAWFVSSLPQVALEGLRAALTAPVALRIGPPVAAPVSLWRVGDGVAVGDAADVPKAAGATVAVDPVALLRFGSGRSSWRDEDVDIDGDADLAIAVLDQVRI